MKNLIYAKDDKIMFSCTDYPLPLGDNAECTLKWKFYKKKIRFHKATKRLISNWRVKSKLKLQGSIERFIKPSTWSDYSHAI